MNGHLYHISTTRTNDINTFRNYYLGNSNNVKTIHNHRCEFYMHKMIDPLVKDSHGDYKSINPRKRNIYID